MATKTKPTVVSDIVAWEEDGAYSRDVVTVAAGQSLALGTVCGVVTASGQVAPYDPTKLDGTETATLILLEAVDTTAGAKKAVALARHAAIVPSRLVWGSGVTTTQHKTDAFASLRALGIIVREEI